MATKKAPKPAKRRSPPSKGGDGNPFDHLEIVNIRLLNLVAHLSIKDGKTPEVADVTQITRIGPSPDGAFLHVNIAAEVGATPAGQPDGGSVMKILVEYQCI